MNEERNIGYGETCEEITRIVQARKIQAEDAIAYLQGPLIVQIKPRLEAIHAIGWNVRGYAAELCAEIVHIAESL